MVGRHVRTRAGVFGAISRNRPHARGRARDRARARYELLDYVGIAQHAQRARADTCRTAISAGSKSRARSRPSRSCSRWTSPPRA